MHVMNISFILLPIMHSIIAYYHRDIMPIIIDMIMHMIVLILIYYQFRDIMHVIMHIMLIIKINIL